MLRLMFGSVIVRDTFCDVVFMLRRGVGPAEWRTAMGPDQAMALVRQLSQRERWAVEALAARVDGSSVARFDGWQDGPDGRIEVLLWSGELVAVCLPPRETAGAGGGGGGASAIDEGPLPDVTTKPLQSDDKDGALSYYELQLFDERNSPVAGVKVKLQTPLGTTFEFTDGDGCVRVDDAPAGFGHASAVATSLREALMGDERRPRRTTPLPEGPPWHVRTMRELSQWVMLPDAERQKLMVITRTVVTHDAEVHKWDELHLLQDGPFHLLASEGMRLALHADGRSSSASVRGAKPEYVSGCAGRTRVMLCSRRRTPTCTSTSMVPASRPSAPASACATSSCPQALRM